MTLFMALFTQFANAQVNMTNGTSEVTSSGVNFYDSGGPGEGGNTRYTHNQEYTYTFTLPALQSESGLKVVFTKLRVNDDHLYIYEGASSANPDKLIADFTCNDYYYSFTDLCASGNITVISHGAITFKFISNEQYRDDGWEATITPISQNDIAASVPAPVIAMEACSNYVQLIPTMLPKDDDEEIQLFYTLNGGSETQYTDRFNVANGTTIVAYSKLVKEGSVIATTATADQHNVTVNRAPIDVPTLTRIDVTKNNELKVERPEVPEGANDTYKIRYTLDGSDPVTSQTAITLEWIHVTGVADRNDSIIDITDALIQSDGFAYVKAVTQGTTCPNIMSAVVEYKTQTLFTATPVITLSGTTNPGRIEISCSTSGATIYYTIDGSTPDPDNNADNTYVWGDPDTPTTIAAGGTVRAYAAATDREPSPVVSDIYVPGGESGGSNLYGSVVLLDDREPHSWSYYSDDEQPIHSLKPIDVKITYKGFGDNTMTSTNSDPNSIPNSAFNANVASDQVAVNKGEAGNQFIYLKTLEATNADGTGNYPYTMIANPFQIRPVYNQNNKGNNNGYDFINLNNNLQNDLTSDNRDVSIAVVSGGTNSNTYLPMYTYYCDYGFACEYIIPASYFTNAGITSGMELTSITLFQSSAGSWVAKNLGIWIGTTTETSFSEVGVIEGSDDTKVYSNSSYSSNSATSHTFNFSSPFTYTGNNLYVYIEAASGGTWASSTWSGFNTTSDSNNGFYYYNNSSGNYGGSGLISFLPNTTFGVVDDGITRYNVNVASMSGGTVTANPTRAEEGATVTLTIASNSGYTLSSITVTGNTSGNTVTLSGSGTTRTFSMPGEDVTVNATFFSAADAWRGFYAWRVKSMSSGLKIIADGTTYTSANIATGIILYPDQDIQFVATGNSTDNEVEFEALWAKAWVTTSTSAQSSGNYASNSGNYKNAYERNFHKVTSFPTHSTYPYTITTLDPDGNGTVGSITLSNSYNCATDVKLENINLNVGNNRYLNANNHSLFIGRGVTNGTSNVAGHIYGRYLDDNNYSTQFTSNNFTLRVESGRYTDVYLFHNDRSSRVTNGFTCKTIFGSDYDRANNTNSNLVVAGPFELGYYLNIVSADTKFDIRTLSGTFGTSSANSEFYMGFELNNESYNCAAVRKLEVLGGDFLGGIAGGIERGVAEETEVLTMRIKGGTVSQYQYGSGQHSTAYGTRKTIITGGTFDCWISGACYGTYVSNPGSSDYSGKTVGNTYVYFGGNAKQNNTNGIFGAGFGENATQTDYYTVLKSFVVVADDATTTGSVYGGGNNGYTKSDTEVWILGGGDSKMTVSGDVYGGANLSHSDGTTKVTMKGGTVNGSVYGGASGASATNDIVYVTGMATVDIQGGTVKDDVYGGGYGTQTVMRGGTTVTVSGGTINNNVYGGGALGTVGRTSSAANAVVTISGDAEVKNVYGAGKGSEQTQVPVTNANIFGTTTVTVTDDAHVLGSVYGGGENGSVGYYNNSSTATGSTVNISGGTIDENVFGGGSFGVTNGNTIVNITWKDDEKTKTMIKGNVYGGAFGKKGKVYVNGTKTVNMNNGIVGNSVYGGSRNADDALAWTGTTGTTTTSNVVNISGGEVHYSVFAAGYFGHTYGSVYAFIGENAIKKALEHAETTTFNYAINPLYIKGSVWAGGDFGNFDGTNFGDPTIEGKSYVYIDGKGYNTITDHPQVTGYMNIGGSVYGCGTSCDAGKADTKVVIREYGQPVASGAKNIDEPYQTATRALYSIQRAKTVILDNAHINYLGQGKVNSLVTTEKFAIHNVENVLNVVNASSVMINYPIDEIKKLVNGTCTNVYAASPTFSPVNLPESGSISVENKYRVYNGTYINIHYGELYGELSGFAYMMTDAYQGEDDTKSCAYARPKWGQGAAFDQGDTSYDNANDGGFISYTDSYNEFDAEGNNDADGVQMRYENHVLTSKVGEQYFRIWRYGGLYSYREGVLIAKSSGEDGTYNTCEVVIDLPAPENGGYYRIQAKNGGTTISYGTDVMTCNVGYYGSPYSTTASNWMYYGNNAWQTGKAMTDSNIQSGLGDIDDYANVNFGLVAIPQGAMTATGTAASNANWLIFEGADALLANANTKWTYSNSTGQAEVLFRLTYSNEISVNKALDPITIYFEQYNADGDLVDVVQVALIITTKTSIDQDVNTRVVAIMQGKGELGDIYSGRVTLPTYPVYMNDNGDPSVWTIKDVQWTDEVGNTSTGAQLVKNNSANYDDEESKFGMTFYAAQNKDYTWGWDDYDYGPFDAKDGVDGTINGQVIGKTTARKDFTINFDLYYDGELTSTTTQLGTLTFTFHFTHYKQTENGQEVDGSGDIDIVIDVWRKGTGTNYYLDGEHGDNGYDGDRPDAAKKTLNAILTRTDYSAGDNIFIVNTVTQDDAATLIWDGTDYDNITIYRYPGGHPMAKNDASYTRPHWADYPEANSCFSGVLVDVKKKMELHYVTLDGFSEEISKAYPAGCGETTFTLTQEVKDAFAATAPMVEIENGGLFTMANGALLTHNANTSATNGGGAVKVDEGGTLAMTVNSTITGNSTAFTGGGVYMEGTMNISGLVNVTGNTKAASSKDATENNVFLSEFAKTITMAGEVDPESRIGVTKDDWNKKWYNPVVYSETQANLDVFYTDHDLERLTDDKGMYQLNKLNLSNSEFQNSKKYLFFVGTWVTAVHEEPTDFDAQDIDTPEELAWAISVATGYNNVNNGNGYPNTNFKLTADIDMDDNIWVPIGNEQVKYTGTFDGNGHVVTGIRSPLDASDKGMFGVINGAKIENMIIKTEFSDGNSTDLGGLVGHMENGTISNCEVAGEITGNDNTQNLGGLVAKVDAGTIHSVFAVSTLTGGTETVMGGLIGTNANNGNLFNSYSNVEMSGSETMAGLVGNNGGRVENCYVIGTLTPAFAVTNTGQINYCYAQEGITNYAPGTLSKHGNYAPVQTDIKALDYMYGDNKVTASGNGYVKTTHEYVNNHTVLWDGLLSVLNQWVADGQIQDKPSGLATWNRPVTTTINGDLPILAFSKDNCLGNQPTADGKMLRYGACDEIENDVQANNGLDNLLVAYKDQTANIFLYGNAINVENVPTANVNVTVNEDAVLMQKQQPDGTKANEANFINTIVGVTFDNSAPAETAYDYFGNELEYDWHLMSTPLSDAKLGITYTGSNIGYGNDADWDKIENGYFPNMTNGNKADDVSWDFYTYFEPQYHWINFKRSAGNHWHYDEPHGNIDYTGTEQSLGKLTAGRGYMMAISQDSYLSNMGTLNNGDVEIKLTHTASDEGNDPSKDYGWNLVGNPYQAYLDIAQLGKTVYGYDADNGVYAPYVSEASENPAILSQYIHPHQAFFVYTEEGETMTFDYDQMATATSLNTSYFRGEVPVNYPVVNLFVENETGNRDLAIVELNRPELGGAYKVNGLRNANFKLFAHYEGNNYGLLFTPEDAERVPVHFRTMEDGTFTLTWQTMHGTFTNLILVDNLTGTRTNMLTTDHYTFEGSVDDYAARFYITFNVTGVNELNGENDDFTWFDGNDWIVTGKGQLDVIDVTGRVLRTERVSGEQTRLHLDGVAAGVYMMRLTDGNKAKTQKIVIR